MLTTSGSGMGQVDRFGSNTAWDVKDEAKEKKWRELAKEQREREAEERAYHEKVLQSSTAVLQAELREMRQRFAELNEKPEKLVRRVTRKKKKKKRNASLSKKQSEFEDSLLPIVGDPEESIGLRRAAELAGVDDAADLLKSNKKHESKSIASYQDPTKRKIVKRQSTKAKRLPKLPYKPVIQETPTLATLEPEVPPHLRRARKLLGRVGKGVSLEDLQVLTDLLNPCLNEDDELPLGFQSTNKKHDSNLGDEFSVMMNRFFPGLTPDDIALAEADGTNIDDEFLDDYPQNSSQDLTTSGQSLSICKSKDSEDAALNSRCPTSESGERGGAKKSKLKYKGSRTQFHRNSLDDLMMKCSRHPIDLRAIS